MDLDDIEYQDELGGELSQTDKIHIVALEIEEEREKMEQKKSSMNQQIKIAKGMASTGNEPLTERMIDEAEEIRKEALEHKVRMEELEEKLRKYVREQYYN